MGARDFAKTYVLLPQQLLHEIPMVLFFKATYVYCRPTDDATSRYPHRQGGKIALLSAVVQPGSKEHGDTTTEIFYL